MSNAVNNPKTAHWQALSQAHHLAPFSDYKQLAEKGPRIITEAKGVHLWDSEGNKILDGMAGLFAFRGTHFSHGPYFRSGNYEKNWCAEEFGDQDIGRIIIQ